MTLVPVTPGKRQFLSMSDRVPNGEPLNDALAAMQQQREARRVEQPAPKLSAATPCEHPGVFAHPDRLSEHCFTCGRDIDRSQL